MPIKDTIRAALEGAVKALREVVEPLASITFVEAKDQAVPVCNLDSPVAILYALLLFLEGDFRGRVVERSIVFGILVGKFGAQEVLLGGKGLELLEPFG